VVAAIDAGLLIYGSLGLFFIGLGVWAIVHGKTSSRIGTTYRSKDPGAFWFGVLFWFFFGICLLLKAFTNVP
jgi:hypothetical protein